jgi:hypothetical protein
VEEKTLLCIQAKTQTFDTIFLEIDVVYAYFVHTHFIIKKLSEGLICNNNDTYISE